MPSVVSAFTSEYVCLPVDGFVAMPGTIVFDIGPFTSPVATSTCATPLCAAPFTVRKCPPRMTLPASDPGPISMV